MDEFLRRRADRVMPAVLLPDTTLTDSRPPRKRHQCGDLRWTANPCGTASV